MLRRLLTSVAVAVAVAGFVAPRVEAMPPLQLYSPDAVFDAATDSWIISDDTFELWIIGDVGGVGDIYDIDLVASYYGASGSIEITPIYPLDPTPGDSPAYGEVVNDPDFANADGHMFWSLGDMVDDPNDPNDLASIMNYQPGMTGTSTGIITKLMVHVSGYDAVHWDAFDHYYTGGIGNSPSAAFRPHYVFAPFSATTNGPPEAAEPGSLALLAIGLAGAAMARRRRR